MRPIMAAACLALAALMALPAHAQQGVTLESLDTGLGFKVDLPGGWPSQASEQPNGVKVVAFAAPGAPANGLPRFFAQCVNQPTPLAQLIQGMKTNMTRQNPQGIEFQPDQPFKGKNVNGTVIVGVQASNKIMVIHAIFQIKAGSIGIFTAALAEQQTQQLLPLVDQMIASIQLTDAAAAQPGPQPVPQPGLQKATTGADGISRFPLTQFQIRVPASFTFEETAENARLTGQLEGTRAMVVLLVFKTPAPTAGNSVPQIVESFRGQLAQQGVTDIEAVNFKTAKGDLFAQRGKANLQGNNIAVIVGLTAEGAQAWQIQMTCPLAAGEKGEAFLRQVLPSFGPLDARPGPGPTPDPPKVGGPAKVQVDSAMPLVVAQQFHGPILASAKVSAEANARADAIAAVAKGDADGLVVVLPSRGLSAAMQDIRKEFGADPQWRVLAMRAAVALVHPDNPVQEISAETLAKILSGAADAPQTWGDLDPKLAESNPELASAKIRRLAPPQAASAWRLAEGALEAKFSGPAGAAEVPGAMALAQEVANDLTALGLADASWLAEGVKALAIAPLGGGAAVAPSESAIGDGSYPLSERLAVIFKAPPRAEFAAWLAAWQSPAGQRRIAGLGLDWQPLNVK